jgi:hypothetical protein
MPDLSSPNGLPWDNLRVEISENSREEPDMPLARRLLAPLLLLPLAAPLGDATADDDRDTARPLHYTVSWIGNTFPGGDGEWVQNNIAEVAVTADGTVYASSEWDEAGRCTGAYKDGHANRQLFKQFDGKGGHKAWGWGTAGKAVAADKIFVYIINTEGELLRFRRGDSGYVDQTLVGKAVDMACRDGVLTIVLEGGEIQRRRASDPATKLGSFQAAGAADVAVGADGRIWLRLGKEVRAFAADGTRRPESITDLEDPSDIAIGHDGRLIICDNGKRGQILFYDVAGAPRLVAEFGDRGGLRSGVPGVVAGAPRKLFSIRGAGTDAEGNLYVALSKNMSILRKFTPHGDLVWELQGLFFVDATSVLPGSDGTEIYGREEIFTFDYDRPAGSRAWTLKAFTADFDRNPDDPRKDPAGMGRVRLVDGHRLLFVSGMMAGPMPVFYFAPETHGQIAIDSGLRKGEGWASWADSRGGIWYVKNSAIIHEPLSGFAPDGKPIYGKAQATPLPKEFRSVERVLYDPERDIMILTGFTHNNPDPGGAWGLAGTEAFRYDHWSSGPRFRWRAQFPFRTWEKGGAGEMIMPKAVDIAGDYLFVCYVYRGEGEGSNPPVRIYRLDDGVFVGELRPGGVVGREHGWVDIVQGMSAFQRSNGEYVVLVEEDYRGKNVLYRWNPDVGTTPSR